MATSINQPRTEDPALEVLMEAVMRSLLRQEPMDDADLAILRYQTQQLGAAIVQRRRELADHG